MKQEEIIKFKKILVEEKKSMINNINFGLDVNLNESIGELSGYDNHPADIGTELFERGKDIALKENEQHILDLINDALIRIEQNEYGFCAECKREIPIERLKVVPYAKYCIEHQPNSSVSDKRPVEEEFLDIPYKDANNDDIYIEDSWSKVVNYGTSSSIDSNFNDFDDDDLYDNDLTDGFMITDIYGNPLKEQTYSRDELLESGKFKETDI